MRTPLITRQGYEKLKQELDDLWRIERPEVTKIVSWAASLGDRSENADYQYNKKRLREIDPDIKAIVSSGYSNAPIMSDYKRYGFCDVIPKPYRIKELSELLNKVISSAK